VIFPESGQTKGQLADYYTAIAPLMLAHMSGRPISLVRCPQGRDKKCFFQKHDSGGFGPEVHHVPIREKDGGHEDYLYVESAAGILSCVQMGTIEFHGWDSHASDVEAPDRFVATMSKAKRVDRIFIDYLRNQRGSTAVMPYSARARAGAPVAAPVTWEELKGIESAHEWSIGDAKELIERANGKGLKGWGFAAQGLPGV
jgi:DNA primase